jgi:HD-GYP domain-containing protein (c-di-GMP phosphodiesterase class II)
MGLAGNAITPAGRIVAVADAFDVLTHDRPWRTARPVPEAMAEIRRCAGSHFDPQVVDALAEVLMSMPADIAAIANAPMVMATGRERLRRASATGGNTAVLPAWAWLRYGS